MTVRIGGAGGAQWGTHIASIHLRTDCVRLSADMRAGADERKIRSDKAAIVDSRPGGCHRVASGTPAKEIGAGGQEPVEVLSAPDFSYRLGRARSWSARMASTAASIARVRGLSWDSGSIAASRSPSRAACSSRSQISARSCAPRLAATPLS